jgi:hypothetical protein
VFEVVGWRVMDIVCAQQSFKLFYPGLEVKDVAIAIS